MLFDTTQCFIIYKVLSHTLLHVDRENPADKWGDRQIQANQTEERGGSQSERGQNGDQDRQIRKTESRKEKGGHIEIEAETVKFRNIGSKKEEMKEEYIVQRSCIMFLRDVVIG